MCALRLTVSRRSRQALARQLNTAQQLGKLHHVNCLLALLAITAGQSGEPVALTRRITPKTVPQWVRLLLVAGLQGLRRTKPTGRPSKLTKPPPHPLAGLLDEGPGPAGCAAACWRSPMLQPLIHERLGGYSNVFSIAQLLKHRGVSSQQATCGSDHLHNEKRQEWGHTTWPQSLTMAKAQSALLLCGDEASFPPWGPLSYPWARRGHPPVVKTAGKRQGEKVFGLIESFSGRVSSQGHEARLTSESYSACLPRVWEQTTQHIMLLQDGASYHTAAAMQACFAHHPARRQVFQRPSYAPDDNPSEKWWKTITKEGTPLPYFPTFEALKEKVEQTLLPFEHTPAERRALCRLPMDLAKVA